MGAASLGLLVIATGRYLDFAARLAKDVDQHVAGGRSVTMNLLTDRADEVPQVFDGLDHLQVNPLAIPSLRWPEASLLRYQVMQRFWDDIEGQQLVYLDADLEVVASFEPALQELATSPLLAVQHPGYYRRGFRGPRGTWETRHESLAYVPRRKRKTYACGGVWMGTRQGVHDLSAELEDRVERDSARGVMAVWHDESHWNWFVAEHGVPALSPAYCCVPDYPWLQGIDPVIIAVDKGSDFVRDSTATESMQAWRSR